MIFVTVGSQKFQFNRLLRAVDDLVGDGSIEDRVFVQTGYSDYIPRNCGHKDFLSREEYARMESEADIIITHGGTGAMVGALKKGKKVIAVPRLAKYGEHVDNHQTELIAQFKSQNLICGLSDCGKLPSAVRYVKNHEFAAYESNAQVIIANIEQYIKSL